MKYSEVKHDDKFHEALSKAWDRMQPYALHAGVAVGVVLVVAAVWMAVARHRTSSADEPWAERHTISRRFLDAVDETNSEEQSRKLVAELEAFVETRRGSPAAAITLLQMAQRQLDLADNERPRDATKAKEHLARAAKAAEQFVADFPDHPLLPYAHFTAGKARLDHEDYTEAAKHFAAAEATEVAFLKALTQLHKGLCYEKLGQLDQARAAYTTVRGSKGPKGQPTWCAEQADYHLARLRGEPAKGS